MVVKQSSTKATLLTFIHTRVQLRFLFKCKRKAVHGDMDRQICARRVLNLILTETDLCNFNISLGDSFRDFAEHYVHFLMSVLGIFYENIIVSFLTSIKLLRCLIQQPHLLFCT